MSKITNIAATFVEANEARFDAINATPGAFFWFVDEGASEEGGIFCSCPCGCQKPIRLPTVKSDQNSVAWVNSGSHEKPTLSPSIGIYPWQGEVDKEADGYHWHGYLRSGIWESM